MPTVNLLTTTVDGPTITAAARTSVLNPDQSLSLPPEFWRVGDILEVKMFGRISCAVTTPGTARFDICLGAAAATIIFDTGALGLNIVAKTTVPWQFEAQLLCRAVGATTTTTFFPKAWFASEAVVGAPLPAAGGNGFLNVPVGATAVGAGCDNTARSFLGINFTQTEATGSMTVHGIIVNAIRL